MLDRARPIGAPDSRSARTTASADERSASGADAGVFPAVRLRRNRKSAWARAMVAENRLTPNDLIWPLFVTAGKAVSEPVASMPGVSRLSVDNIVKAAREAADLGIPVVSIFPFTDPKLRSDDGKEAVNQDNLVCCAVRAIRDAGIEIGVLCDVALDPYTSHGHDGLLIDGRIENDATVEVLQHQALIQAEAGCDIVAPSDMMDGRIGAIRCALEDAGHCDVQIMSYAAKYASAFYGPFRDAIGSKGALKGDKRTYQMDPANGAEALREVALDIREGADIVMVKPGMAYLDIVQRVKAEFNIPLAAYQVSGEYAMLRCAIDAGWLDADRVIGETLLAFRRAGADAVLTYFARDVARTLNAV